MAAVAMTRYQSDCVRVSGLCDRQLALSLLSSSTTDYGALTRPMDLHLGAPLTPAPVPPPDPPTYHSSALKLIYGRQRPQSRSADSLFPRLTMFFFCFFFWTPLNQLVKML